MLNTFSDLYKEVLRISGLEPTKSKWQTLGKKWVNIAYQEFNNRYNWPWTVGRYSIQTVENYETGTVTVTQDSRTVTGSGTAWDSSMVGRVFMLTDDEPDRYFITAVNSATELILEQPFIDSSDSGKSYRIWKKFYTLPSDIQNIFKINGPYKQILWTGKEDFDAKFPASFLGRQLGGYWTDWGMDYKQRSYSTGTVSASADSSTLTGDSTSWMGNVFPGDKITIGSDIYHIKSVDTDTQITIVEKFTSAVSSGTGYTIVSEGAPTIQISGTPSPAQNIEILYKKKTYYMVHDDEIPNIPKQFFDALLQGGLRYAFEYQDDNREAEQRLVFEGEILNAIRFYDQSHKPERGIFTPEVYGMFS